MVEPRELPEPRPAVAGLPAYVAGRKALDGDMAALASNESHHPPLPAVLAAIAAAAARVNRYPDMATATLRERLAADLGVDAAQLAVGPGSVGVLSQLVSALCDPGDEVVFAWRSFEAYPILCQIAGAVAVQVPLTAAEQHDRAAMAAAVTQRTKLILLCSPNNPTGTAIAEADLADFLDRIPARVLVVLDEAYREFMTGGGPDSLALYRRHPNLCLLRTFSKAHGLAGLRVGYAIARPEIAEGLRRTQVPFSVSGVAEAAALAALDCTAEVADRAAAVATERPRVEAAARSLGWAVPDGQANFLWLRVADAERERLVAAFEAARIMVRGYAGDGVRVTLADPATNDRVLAVLAGFGRDEPPAT